EGLPRQRLQPARALGRADQDGRVPLPPRHQPLRMAAMKRLDRRTFLRGAAGTALALPLLEAMSSPRRARAQEMAAPRRIIFVFSANGDETDQRFATMDETSFELGEF